LADYVNFFFRTKEKTDPFPGCPDLVFCSDYIRLGVLDRYFRGEYVIFRSYPHGELPPRFVEVFYPLLKTLLSNLTEILCEERVVKSG